MKTGYFGTDISKESISAGYNYFFKNYSDVDHVDSGLLSGLEAIASTYENKDMGDDEADAIEKAISGSYKNNPQNSIVYKVFQEQLDIMLHFMAIFKYDKNSRTIPDFIPSRLSQVLDSQEDRLDSERYMKFSKVKAWYKQAIQEKRISKKLGEHTRVYHDITRKQDLISYLDVMKSIIGNMFKPKKMEEITYAYSRHKATIDNTVDKMNNKEFWEDHLTRAKFINVISPTVNQDNEDAFHKITTIQKNENQQLSSEKERYMQMLMDDETSEKKKKELNQKFRLLPHKLAENNTSRTANDFSTIIPASEFDFIRMERILNSYTTKLHSLPNAHGTARYMKSMQKHLKRMQTHLKDLRDVFYEEIRLHQQYLPGWDSDIMQKVILADDLPFRKKATLIQPQ